METPHRGWFRVLSVAVAVLEGTGLGRGLGRVLRGGEPAVALEAEDYQPGYGYEGDDAAGDYAGDGAAAEKSHVHGCGWIGGESAGTCGGAGF